MQAGHGTATDRLRLALVYLLTCEALPSDAELAPVETALSAPRYPSLEVILVAHSRGWVACVIPGCPCHPLAVLAKVI